MKHDWIIGVIADLNRYATRHGLDDLSRHLGAALTSAREDAPQPREGYRGAHVSREKDAIRRIAERAGGGG
jgi:hypothetical protein